VLLGEFPLDRAVASDLSRARETAEIVIGTRPIALELDPDWREMRFGVWEGLAWPEIVARDPSLNDAHRTVPKFYTPAGGESFEDICERVARAVERIAERAFDGERILVATHAGALHALLRVVLGESEATALGVKFAPATLTRIAFAPSGARVVDLNRSPDAAQMEAGRALAGG
jgi:broad specificity phosphatase PhoE